MVPGNFIVDTVTRTVAVKFSSYNVVCWSMLSYTLSLSLPSSSFLPKIRAILKETHLELYNMTEVKLSLIPDCPVVVVCFV